MSTAAVAEATADVAASPTTVRDRFTSAGMKDWWWPQFSDTIYDFEPEQGRIYRIATEIGGFGVHGEFLDVDENFLVISWVWYGVDGEQNGESTTISFTPINDGAATRVKVVQTAADATIAHESGQGWTAVLERLEELYV